MMQMLRFAPLRGALFAAVAMAAFPALAQQPAPRPPAPAQQRPAAPVPAAPQAELPLPPNGTAVVVADVLLILRDADAVQNVRSQIERQRAAYQTELTRQENDLRAADQELARQRALLSPEGFAQRRRDLEKRVNDAQTTVQNRRKNLDDAFNASMARVNDQMLEIIADMAREKNYQVILPRSQVVLVQNAVDITQEVMRRLNRRMPTVPVTIPQN
jgi:Skp family chaperone for outer membrane proteins